MAEHVGDTQLSNIDRDWWLLSGYSFMIPAGITRDRKYPPVTASIVLMVMLFYWLLPTYSWIGGVPLFFL